MRGGSAIPYYLNKPEKTAETIRDGWVRTGDVYRRDAEGFFWFEGRSDDLFKCSGMWVSPGEVEDAVCRHPAVLEAAVIAEADDTGATIRRRLRAAARPEIAPETKLRKEIIAKRRPKTPAALQAAQAHPLHGPAAAHADRQGAALQAARSWRNPGGVPEDLLKAPLVLGARHLRRAARAGPERAAGRLPGRRVAVELVHELAHFLDERRARHCVRARRIDLPPPHGAFKPQS